MRTASLTQTDLGLRDAVLEQLQWDSGVDPAGIGVTARHGVVALTGEIDSYAGKLAAERAAKRVRGVRAVVNDLQVRLRLERADTDLAADAMRALDLRATVPETVQIVVHNGHLTLTGFVHTLFHRAEAEKAVRHIRGLKGVMNRIHIIAAEPAGEIQRHIVGALRRDADVRGRGIEVRVADGNVTLTGEVATWSERESAEETVRHAPGITHVDNLILVLTDHDADEIC